MGGTTTRYHAVMQFFNGTSIEKTWADTVQNTLGSTLIIDGGSRGATLKLIGLPTGAAGLGLGEVYVDSGGVKSKNLLIYLIV